MDPVTCVLLALLVIGGIYLLRLVTYTIAYAYHEAKFDAWKKARKFLEEGNEDGKNS